MKKKSHPEFVRALKARNLKITVVEHTKTASPGLP